jgi:hypothetical protein
VCEDAEPRCSRVCITRVEIQNRRRFPLTRTLSELAHFVSNSSESSVAEVVVGIIFAAPSTQDSCLLEPRVHVIVMQYRQLETSTFRINEFQCTYRLRNEKKRNSGTYR